ncbi:hypothetical protein EB810_07495 [Altererythrobacter sp. FM1]|uniref:Uncharacterized protein n=1 Tax=Tsuneonella flava TaxID=2055955 RepID=A0ABX7K6U2_9SPHN|nr:hypothetical protein [Tsuneonella flava]QSB43618.1 hypothetical protein IDJ81_09545 [Tsuneonella flava]ROT94977.1 hypothetical protein EB810_07495 [Altererythrobacter sp. FM1]
MEKHGEQVIETETEASAGSKEGVVRWILGISLVLAVGLLTIIWVSGAMTQPVASQPPANTQNSADSGDQENQTSFNGLLEVEKNDAASPAN